MTALTRDLAAGFARTTLSHLGLQWPYKMDHVLNGPDDARPPVDFHPIFHGSFDWHSCVHGWWQVMRIARLFPDLPEAAQARARADAMLVPDKVAGELAYLSRPYSAGFERPYGWAWLLALHAELAAYDAPWAGAVEPLARAFADRFRAYLPKLTYPIWVGTHFNTAFALTLAHDWAISHDPALAALIVARAEHWYGALADCRTLEPGGDEFLSPTLSIAMLMSRIAGQAAFRHWFATFLPAMVQGVPAPLFAPAHVSDRSDGKIAHLDGLNLSRAWAWRGIAARLGDGPESRLARASAQAHLDASLPHIADDYMGSHWLASFALLALEAPAA
ncbi:DUF2891 domain-containing protein [Sphingomonas sp.]|uniref:DUF2891 domain-containing protein n=1 Tax=Sphingomonas sp. TaxID=28214 RepID=UPI001ED572B9|nr:DUF2891 domain-containing protein [Sphingomonas sp.]MBX3595815.1 DUF2891 domain-containing protein [Sphingomonas sp.]